MTDLSLFEADELLALAQIDLNDNKIDHALGKLKYAHHHTAQCPDVVLALLAKIYAQLRLFDRAKPLFAEFLDQHPDAINERFQYGMVHLDSGEPEKSIEIWSAVIQQSPTHPPCLYFSAIARLELNQPNEAKRLLDILLQTAPVDNLYFGRAKELLANFDRKGISAPESRDIYRTNH